MARVAPLGATPANGEKTDAKLVLARRAARSPHFHSDHIIGQSRLS
jgi:hypothetical protein